MQIADWSIHFNFSGTRTTASACSSSLFSDHNIRDSHSTASLSSHCFKGLFPGWHCYLWWLQNLSTYPRTLNNDPSFSWQHGCNYFSSQEDSCWLRKGSSFPGFLQWYLPDKPTNVSDVSQHNTAVRTHWSWCNIYVLHLDILGTYLPHISLFCPDFSGLNIQIKASKIKCVSTHTHWIQVLRMANTSSTFQLNCEVFESIKSLGSKDKTVWNILTHNRIKLCLLPTSYLDNILWSNWYS